MIEPARDARYVPAGFFALRTPLLPFDELLGWSAGLSAVSSAGDSARLDAAYKADKLLLRVRLRDLVIRPEVREALFVASPDLDGRLDVWLREPESEAGQKMERALVRYFTRMAGRPTPFGLCSGCSVGTIGTRTKMSLAGLEQYRRHTRLDMDYVVALAQALASEPAVRPTLAVFPNSSLYTTPGRICYAEVRRNGQGWTHHKIALARSEYLEATLARAAAGARPETLAAALIAGDPEATFDEAGEYIAELTRNQVLVPELIPPITGPEPIHGMAARLRRDASGTAAGILEQTRTDLESLDKEPLGALPERYREVARQLEELPAKVELGRLFQVDMVKPVVEATLGSNVVAEILRGVTILQRLSRRPSNDALTRFRDAFITRYEAREVPPEMPLVEALDSEIGIGFGATNGAEMEASSLLEGLTFPAPEDETTAWGHRETGLLRRLCQALASGAREIRLEPHDVDELAIVSPLPLPNAFSVMGTVAAANDEALARGDFRVLLTGAFGPSGVRMLGRFCHADPLLQELVERHLRAEEALEPDAIFAEIVHLPESRMGNILARPVMRAYEIPYLGRPGVAHECQISITDLLVTVVGSKIILRSKRLGRRVIPRLTSAHNFSTSQEIYRFLCALQGYGMAESLGWDWGPLRSAPELPRVVSGRLVLSRACWRIEGSVLQALGRARGAARFRAVQEWLAARRLPRRAAVQDGDNELPVDFDNVLSVETFVELVKGRDQATLVELFPEPDELVATGPDGRFVHEIVVPFVRTAPAESELQPSQSQHAGGTLVTPSHPFMWTEVHTTKDTRPQNVSATAEVPRPPATRRSFPPGSEWLYAKFYAGPATVEHLLREVVGPVVQGVTESGAADHWFFIRYSDPNWHLRLRFHGDPARLNAEVFPALQAALAPLITDGRIQRVQLDTYEREVERYGGALGIPLAEQMFHADSRAVLELVTASEDARAEARWRLAVVGIDRLLTDLGFDLAARHGVMKQMAKAFAAEFRVHDVLRHQLNDKFRKERKGLEALLASEADLERLTPGATAVFSRRSQDLAPAIGELQGLEKSSGLLYPLTEMAASYIHMYVNRLLPSAHRAQECVLYDFLKRVYESRLARK